MRLPAKAFIASLFFFTVFSGCLAAVSEKPDSKEIIRIVLAESTYAGVRITDVKVIQVLFEKKDQVCKAKLRISVTVEKDLIAYTKKSKRDFMPFVAYWQAKDKKVIDA